MKEKIHALYVSFLSKIKSGNVGRKTIKCQVLKTYKARWKGVRYGMQRTALLYSRVREVLWKVNTNTDLKREGQRWVWVAMKSQIM